MNKPNFEKGNGLIPVIIQDLRTNKVLMLGYMNEEAYQKTLLEEKVTFFSRSKNRLWTKGEESQNYLFSKEILVDCDNDTLLIKAEPAGPTCHTGDDTCFKEENKVGAEFLNHLEQVIIDRKNNPTDVSYTASLFKKGIDKIAQKVGEEAVETIIDAKNNNDELFLGEVADLLYHLLVLLAAKNLGIADATAVLAKREKKK